MSPLAKPATGRDSAVPWPASGAHGG